MHRTVHALRKAWSSLVCVPARTYLRAGWGADVPGGASGRVLAQSTGGVQTEASVRALQLLVHLVYVLEAKRKVLPWRAWPTGSVARALPCLQPVLAPCTHSALCSSRVKTSCRNSASERLKCAAAVARRPVS